MQKFIAHGVLFARDAVLRALDLIPKVRFWQFRLCVLITGSRIKGLTGYFICQSPDFQFRIKPELSGRRYNKNLGHLWIPWIIVRSARCWVWLSCNRFRIMPNRSCPEKSEFDCAKDSLFFIFALKIKNNAEGITHSGEGYAVVFRPLDCHRGLAASCGQPRSRVLRRRLGGRR